MFGFFKLLHQFELEELLYQPEKPHKKHFGRIPKDPLKVSDFHLQPMRQTPRVDNHSRKAC